MGEGLRHATVMVAAGVGIPLLAARPVSPTRVVGLALMAVGVILSQRG